MVNENNNAAECPFLAQKGDPETHYAFASNANYCHKVSPTEPVDLTYQSAVCLSKQHQDCPVFLGKWDSPLPHEIRGEVVKKKEPRTKIWLWLFAILICTILLLLAITNSALLNKFLPVSPPTQEQTSFMQPTTHSPSVTSAISSSPVAIDSPTPTVSATDEIFSPTPTASATFLFPTLGPFIKTPFGPYESFVIHQVAAGESVGKIAEIYNTTSEVIIAVNRLVEDFYFFGETTPTPDPALKPYNPPTPTPPDDPFATPTKPFIPTKTARATITLTPTPYTTPDVWTTVLIHPGDILVILPNLKDYTNITQYQAIYISIAQKVDDLANLYNMTPDEFRYINSLGPGELIASERWIVVPYGGVGSPPTPVPTIQITLDYSSALSPRFGPGDTYLLHMVKPGDNLPFIAGLYQTTEEVLRQANEITDLQPGRVLVVLPGRIDPDGIKPFGTVLIEEDIPVGILASQMRVFESDLVWYNGLEDDQVVLAGQWLIYPNPKPTPTWTHAPLPTKTWGPGPTATKYVGPTHTLTPTPSIPTRTPHP